MNLQEIRETPEADLLERKKELDRRIYDARVQAAVESPDQANTVAADRREIARILTVMRERGASEGASKPAPRDRILYRKKKHRRKVQALKKKQLSRG